MNNVFFQARVPMDNVAVSVLAAVQVDVDQPE
jgi:hypothetical protein